MSLVARAGVLGFAGVALLGGCATRAAPSTAPSTSRSVGPSTSSSAIGRAARAVARATAPAPVCRGQGAGFELSLAAGFRGAASPVRAASWFERRGDVPGFGSAASRWVVSDPSADGTGEATLTDGRVSLHAVRLPDRTWAIDSGRRCG